jgi:hypothetical protein
VITSAVGIRSPPGFTVSWTQLECGDVNAEEVREFIVRYGRPNAETRVLRVAPSSPFTFTNDSLVPLVEYEIEVATVNTLGMGNYSQRVLAVIPDGWLHNYDVMTTHLILNAL